MPRYKMGSRSYSAPAKLPVGGAGLCPVCGLQVEVSQASRTADARVCPRCLAHVSTDGRIIYQPPPEKCLRELTGLPCIDLEHKAWYNHWRERHATQKPLLEE